MSIFTLIVLCIQACLIHNAYSACVGSLGYANGLGGLGSIGYSAPYGAGVGAGWGAVAAPYEGARVAGAYGGVGTGAVAAIGDLGVQGSTIIGGHVPVIGAVQFNGDVPAAGSVSISGNCGCGCRAGLGYYL